MVFDHVSYLAFHGDHEQSDEVHDQNGPKHGYVEHAEERTCHRNRQRLVRCVPEFKLGQTTHERPEFFVRFGGQTGLGLVVVVQLDLVHERRRQKEYELVEQEYAQHIRDYVEALQHHHSVHEKHKQQEVRYPSGDYERGYFVQYALQVKTELAIDSFDEILTAARWTVVERIHLPCSLYVFVIAELLLLDAQSSPFFSVLVISN